MKGLKIPKVKRKCSLDGAPFSDGERFYSTIKIDKGVVERRDFCATCWETSADKEDFFWNGVIATNKVEILGLDAYEKKLFETFVSWYEKLEEDLDYVIFLAHYFKRRKLFFKRGECLEGTQVFEVYQLKQEERWFLIPKKSIAKTSLPRIQQKIKQTC